MTRRTLLVLVPILLAMTILPIIIMRFSLIVEPTIFIIDPFGNMTKMLNKINSTTFLIDSLNITLVNYVAKVVKYGNTTDTLNIRVISDVPVTCVHTIGLCGIALSNAGKLYACINSTCIMYADMSKIEICREGECKYVNVDKVIVLEGKYKILLSREVIQLATCYNNCTLRLELSYGRELTYIVLCLSTRIRVLSDIVNHTVRIVVS